MKQIQPTTILLELLPIDANDADSALLTSIGTEVATILRDQGEVVQPVYSGQRGGELVLQIISAAWTNKDIILSDLSSLVTILTPMVLIAQHIKQAYGKHAGQEVAKTHPVTITLEIHGITLTVEATDATDARTLTTQLAQQILVHSSSISNQAILPQIAKIQAYIPKRPTRKRR